MTVAKSKRIGGVIWAIVLVAYLLRILVALDWSASHPLAEHPVIDEASYEDWAVEIADGGWLGDEVFFQEPLYPYWMGAVYSVFGARNRTAVRHAQALLGALTVLLTALATRRLFGQAAGVAAALLVALHRPGLLFVALLLKPNLLLPIVAGLLLVLLVLRSPLGVSTERSSGASPGLLVRPRALRWLPAGVLVGAGALLRGNMLLLVPFFVLLPLLRSLKRTTGEAARRLDWRGALALLAGVLLVLVPVATRNQVVGGVFALTTSGAGTNVYGGNNQQNPYGRATEFDWVRGIPEYEAGDWRHEAERRVGHALAPDEVSSYWLSETLASMRERPAEHARIFWNKLRLTLGRYEVPDNHHLDWDAQFVALLRVPWPGWSVFGVLGLGGLVAWCLSSTLRQRSLDRGGAWELVGLFVLYVGTIVATVTSMRVRLALVPLLAPFAGLAVVQLCACVPALRRRWTLGPPAAATTVFGSLAVAAVIVWTPLLSAEERGADWFKREFNYAVYLVADGESARARSILLELDERYPGTSRVQTMLAELDFNAALDEFAGEARAETGRVLLSGAMARLRRVAEGAGVNPRERYRAHKLAGRIQRYLGQAAAAGRFYAKALEFDPEDREALNGWQWSRVVAERASVPSGGLGGPQAPKLLEMDELEAWIASVRVEPLSSAPRAAAYAAGATAQLLLEGSERGVGESRARLLAEATAAFRKARELDPDGQDWPLGLANSRYLEAQHAPTGSPLRGAAAREAEALLLELIAAGTGALEARLEEVRALR